MPTASKVYRTSLTPLSFLERSAQVFPDKTAVIHGELRYNYRQFSERVNRLTSALKKRGLQTGDRVAYFCPNIPPMLEAHFGVLQAEAILVPINIRLSSKEVAFILNHSGSRFLFVDTELASVVEPVLSELETVEHIINIKDLPNFSSLAGDNYENFLESGSPDPCPLVLEDEEATICINYTSGTTGNPKGVMYTHRGAYLNSLGEELTSGFDVNTKYLWTLPMFHCNGWCCTWGVTGVGGTHVCLRKVDPGLVWKLIDQEGITHLNGAPVVLTSLMNSPQCPESLNIPITITTAGAPPSPTLIEQVRGIGAKVVHVYGLTETYGPHTVCVEQESWAKLEAKEQATRFARQGVSYLIADPVRVVDKNMNDVPADGQTLGEVTMRGNNVMKGYYNNPQKTAEAFEGGWFHSGDVGVMHPDGYIELKDRSKDVIITGGENVSSIEVEQVIYRNPAVLEVAVVGIPDEKWGETIKAFVCLKKGAQLSEQELIDFCREQIAHFKCPRSIEFGELPKTGTGKIQKFVLREKEWSGQKSRIH
ncbi:MAG: long-chain-fatty-acid--CoA ligase [SAR324 cluster bacterium]|nr:long-chain-fatty-acid--CoA ligase [SAR324 cluster bacterium]